MTTTIASRRRPRTGHSGVAFIPHRPKNRTRDAEIGVDLREDPAVDTLAIRTEPRIRGGTRYVPIPVQVLEPVPKATTDGGRPTVLPPNRVQGPHPGDRNHDSHVAQSTRAVGMTHRGQPYRPCSCAQQFRGTRACGRTGGAHIIHEQDAPVFRLLGSEDTPLRTTPGVPSPTRLRAMRHTSQRSRLGNAERASHATAQTLSLVKAALQSPPRMHRDRHDDIHAWDSSRQDLAEGISKGIDQQGVRTIFCSADRSTDRTVVASERPAPAQRRTDVDRLGKPPDGAEALRTQSSRVHTPVPPTARTIVRKHDVREEGHTTGEEGGHAATCAPSASRHVTVGHQWWYRPPHMSVLARYNCSTSRTRASS